MPIEFKCESCSKTLRVPDGTGGKQCLCPGCSKVLDIPVPKVEPPASIPSPSDGADIVLCIPCPKCKHELKCDPSLVGTKGQCRSCKHIFIINDLPTNEVPLSVTNLFFSCPKCAQLFEGSEEKRGKRGKCHSCGEVFYIELRVADDVSTEKPEKNSKEKRSPASPTPSNRLNSFDDGELTIDASDEELKPIVEPKAKPNRPSMSSGTVVSKALRSDLPAIQFNCKSCKGRMEVPGEAAKQLTHCPHCKRQLTVPSESEPTPEALAANDPWADLSPLGSAPAPMQQASPFGDTLYPPPTSTYPLAPNRRRGDDPTQHIICGIFISLFALIGIVIEILQLGINILVYATMPTNDPGVSGIAIAQIVMWSFILILSIVQLVGGIALARRTGINIARAGVIICCLPCFCLINMVVGIWGCILVFGNNAERDFR